MSRGVDEEPEVHSGPRSWGGRWSVEREASHASGAELLKKPDAAGKVTRLNYPGS